MIIGIDLGTTNSLAAYWDEEERKAVLIPNSHEEYLTPSVVNIEKKKFHVGKVAKSRLKLYPEQSASIFKRYIGTNRKIKLGRKSYSAEELSSMILESLKQDAERFLDKKVSEAVISVPAYFNNLQRQATITAGELAGLKVKRIINEPTAAALAYGHSSKNDKVYIILDLGGGTFDVSLVDFFDDIVEIKASSGDNFLGGEDFTQEIYNYLLDEFNLNEKKLDNIKKNTLYELSESLKKRIEEEKSISVENPFDKAARTSTFTVNTYYKLAEHLLDKIVKPIKVVLKDSKVNIDEIDEVILVGGSTRMKLVKKEMAKTFRMLPKSQLDPDTVVALGAATQAGMLSKGKGIEETILTDVCPFSLGTEVLNQNSYNHEGHLVFCPIIERNSTVPCSREETLYTAADKQRNILFNIYQGESRLCKNNILLGKIDIVVPPKLAGEESITARFSYDMNGVLEVDIKVNSTGEQYQKTILNSLNSLSEDEINKSKAKLAKLKIHPKDDDQNIYIINQAEEAYKNSLGEERQIIQNLISSFESSLLTQDFKKISVSKNMLVSYLESLK